MSVQQLKLFFVNNYVVTYFTQRKYSIRSFVRQKKLLSFKKKSRKKKYFFFDMFLLEAIFDFIL